MRTRDLARRLDALARRQDRRVAARRDAGGGWIHQGADEPLDDLLARLLAIREAAPRRPLLVRLNFNEPDTAGQIIADSLSGPGFITPGIPQSGDEITAWQERVRAQQDRLLGLDADAAGAAPGLSEPPEP